MLAANRDIGETYQRDGFGPAMAKFIRLVMLEGPLPATYADEPAPDPAAFGLPTEDDGSRDDALLAQNNRSCVPYEPDLDRLRAASTRVVVVGGEASARQLAAVPPPGVAAALGTGSRCSPATTRASSAASSARPACPSRSPRGCARCSPQG